MNVARSSPPVPEVVLPEVVVVGDGRGRASPPCPAGKSPDTATAAFKSRPCSSLARPPASWVPGGWKMGWRWRVAVQGVIPACGEGEADMGLVRCCPLPFLVQVLLLVLLRLLPLVLLNGEGAGAATDTRAFQRLAHSRTPRIHCGSHQRAQPANQPANQLASNAQQPTRQGSQACGRGKARGQGGRESPPCQGSAYRRRHHHHG